MAYRETAAPAPLSELVECLWTNDSPSGDAHVLPDGCMDLIRMNGRVIVAGPDTSATRTAAAQGPVEGLRFRPGVLPRLLGVPAVELADRRIPLADVRGPSPRLLDLVELTTVLAANRGPRQTAPWRLATLHHVTRRLDSGAPVGQVADEIGWSARTLQRKCETVYGYGPAKLRRILRFRRAVRLLRSGHAAAHAAAECGYADQPHLHREVREFAGTSIGGLAGI